MSFGAFSQEIYGDSAPAMVESFKRQWDFLDEIVRWGEWDVIECSRCNQDRWLPQDYIQSLEKASEKMSAW